MPLERQPPPIADAISDGIGLTPMVKLSHPSKGRFFFFFFTLHSYFLKKALISFFFFVVNTFFLFSLLWRAHLTHQHIIVQLFGKLELANPTGSIKDRVAKYLLQGKNNFNVFHIDMFVVCVSLSLLFPVYIESDKALFALCQSTN